MKIKIFISLVLFYPINKSYLLPIAVFILHEERFHIRIWILRFAYEKFVKFESLHIIRF